MWRPYRAWRRRSAWDRGSRIAVVGVGGLTFWLIHAGQDGHSPLGSAVLIGAGSVVIAFGIVSAVRWKKPNLAMNVASGLLIIGLGLTETGYSMAPAIFALAALATGPITLIGRRVVAAIRARRAAQHRDRSEIGAA
jgi:hypothetical protein